MSDLDGLLDRPIVISNYKLELPTQLLGRIRYDFTKIMRND